jgi:DNA topoisomerase-1
VVAGQKAQTALKSLGEHPELGGEIKVLAGRYGPYVKHGKINATIPKGTEPERITMDEAVKLIAERAANGKGAGTKTKAKTKAKSAKPKQKAPSANSEASA